MPAIADERKSRKPLEGRAKPRLAPPTPARTKLADFEAAAGKVGIELMPWQREAGRYLYATGSDDRWLYQEVAVIVARQNGKSELLLPLVIERLGQGRRIVHAAQSRDLPRKFFERRLVPEVERHFGFKARIRKGAGQESIEIDGGGSYTIVAGTGGAPRGQTFDDILLDEVRELKPDFVFAVLPTSIASKNRQTVYLSNAGSEDSTVLNTIRLRADDDPALAWLEWSAGPDRAVDDPAGWAEANPALGHTLTEQSVAGFYTSNKLGGTLAAFETEHLCRWVTTMRERLVDDFDWTRCKGELGKPLRPSIGVSIAPEGTRASIALAWMVGQQVALRMIANVSAEHVDIDAIGQQVRDLSVKYVATVAYDPLTDAELVKYVAKGKAKSYAGNGFAWASNNFALAVSSNRLVWDDCDPVTDDLTWTARKTVGVEGSYEAVRAKDDRPITAALAAIRAVALASGPTQPRAPRIR